ncbi:hypothetical protein BpHYR1_051743 [Brachionus plicatilis]|uniref:Integrase zinc-binding domain-containing protein n=1 Tax=Brachionus plicatilis TaxID=10195 RepID=A0A3M7SZH8_BRAPC|nr:hypothetical protein BpHYR1_051743 [Brachionus plicatilis]
MSEIGSIIEDIDSKKWKKIKALNICKAKSLAYSLDKVVAAYRATVAELKDIAESNDATETRKSKCKECIKVPKPELRVEIIEKAHNFGQFQTESTYQRLKDTFYWKNIFDDIKKFVKKCTVCNRNNKEIKK